LVLRMGLGAYIALPTFKHYLFLKCNNPIS
jgi:hypothetical protein